MTVGESVCISRYLGVGEEEDGLQVLGPCTHEHALEVLVELVHAVPTLHIHINTQDKPWHQHRLSNMFGPSGDEYLLIFIYLYSP